MPHLISVMACRAPEPIAMLLKGCASAEPLPWRTEADLEKAVAGGVAFVVAYREGVPVGALAYRLKGGSLTIEQILVLPDARREGVALRMLRSLEALGIAMGAPALTAASGVAMPLGRLGYVESDGFSKSLRP